MQKQYDFVIIETEKVSGHWTGPDGEIDEYFGGKKIVVRAVFPDLPAAQTAAESFTDSEKERPGRFEGITYTIQMFPKGTVEAGQVISDESYG